MDTLRQPLSPDVSASARPARHGLHPNVDQWWTWTRVGLYRLPMPYWVSIVVVAIAAFGEQLVEYSLVHPNVNDIPLNKILQSLVVPAVFVYLLIALRVLKRGSIKLLNRLRRVVKIDDDAYNGYVRRMVCIDLRIDLTLLLASSVLLVSLLLPLRMPTPMGGGIARLPANWLTASYILLTYILLGWLLLLLLYTSVLMGRELNALAREPIDINVFDPLERLPFGQLSLLHSLTLAGLVLVVVIPLGRPTEFIEYFMLTLLSIGSLLALVLPLRGVRRQVERAKNDVLEKLYHEFEEIQNTLMAGANREEETLEVLAERADVLDNLRTRVLRAPTWPFRNASAAIRAGIAAASPVLYFALTEILGAALNTIFGG